MAEERKHTIVVKSNKVEVSKEVYYAYQRMKDKERYQKQQKYENELSLERFWEDGVSVEFRNHRYQLAAEEEVILREQRRALGRALSMLNQEERFMIQQLFFEGLSEREVAKMLGISQQAVSKRKVKIVNRLRGLLE